MDAFIISCSIATSSGFETVTKESLKWLFGAFGPILDMQVSFGRKAVKALIKYQEQESASKAYEILNDKKSPFGHLDIFLTEFTEIPKKDKFLSQKMDPLQAVNISSLLKFPSSNYKTPKVFANKGLLPTTEISDHTLESSPEHHAIYKQSARKLKNQNSLGISSNSTLNLKTLNSAIPVMPMQFILSHTGEDLSPSRISVEGTSPVLEVHNLESQNLRPKFITNLFGCFGNVLHVLFNKKLAFAFIEFENTRQAELALKSLDDFTFFGAQLKVEFSAFKRVSRPNSLSDSEDLVFFKNDPKAFRYSRENSIRVNGPSSLLHVTGIPEQVTPLILFQIVQQIREPVKIIQLKRHVKNYHMYLLQFESLEHSLEVLSVLHNKQINEKYVKISFSHSKLD